MTGAIGLKGGLLDASIMLNLDTEEDTDLTIGCAGGVDVTISGTYASIESTVPAYTIRVKGLQGGHSGMEIHKGLGNANKIMNRILWTLNKSCAMDLITIDGGGLRNAIPRESSAIIGFADADRETVKKVVTELGDALLAEYNVTDVNLGITLDPAPEMAYKACSENFKNDLLNSIYSCPVGIYRMSPSIPDLVQTSNNLARVILKDGEFTIMCLTRSSVDTEKTDLANAIEACFAPLHGTTSFSGTYPGWEPKPESTIVALMSELYQELFGKSADVNACHAGLECGILGTNYPDMQMISFGPNIRGAHSPDECTQISSVQKFWGYLLETLKRIPA